uniref:RNA helicase n=1 Tax=Dunaliella tertiolecta TaxID=3047 RepID=A0A7S3QQS8_DUNTE
MDLDQQRRDSNNGTSTSEPVQQESRPNPPKRYRRTELDEEEERKKNLLEQEDGDDEEYVPLTKRRQMEEQRLRQLLKGGPLSESDDFSREASRDRSVGPPEMPPAGATEGGRPKESLLLAAARAKQNAPEQSKAQAQLEEEADIMKHVLQKNALKAVKELATGTVYTKSMATGWKPPLKYRLMPESERQKIREMFRIIVDGHNVPPPITNFRDMKIPPCVIQQLEAKGIKKPTPIQAQGLPVAMAGRDMIGIAFTGSGKTLVFCLPMILISLQDEMMLPVARNEGPIGLVVCPSRELARQTHDVIVTYCSILAKEGYPELRTMLVMGGIDPKLQYDTLKNGCHMAVCTPGRLKDLLHKKRMTLDICRYICLDEADRMVDGGFEEEMRDILSYFKGQRQTLMFSATMPASIKAFAESALVDPIEVNVGRAGAANLDVIQEVEYVKEEVKLQYLLECLQKTAPPVLVFAENKRDVDAIHEYLLVQGVEAVAIHGDKEQEERERSIDAFKSGEKDVLVATDVASKGLDFAEVQHVINYDMPSEIENYVHRIGRTGRCGKTGVASTFINTRYTDETILLDLKHLLKEAKQV